MSYLLKPLSGQFLLPDEIIERLQNEFAVVNADRHAGSDYVGDVIAGLIRVGLSGEPIESLLQVQDNAYRIYVADEAGATEEFLDLIVVPNRPINVSIYNQDRMQPMLKRCAQTLQYSIEW
jgi:hypothetical protein